MNDGDAAIRSHFGLQSVSALSAIVFGWSALTLMLLYWIENLIIGAINALKMIVSGAAAPHRNLIATLLLTAFFLLHYALFCAIHGVIIFSLFDRGTTDVDLFNLPSVVIARLKTDPMLFWNAVLLAVFHLLSFLIYWVAPGTWRDSDLFAQMFAPYSRIVLVHLTIMLAAVPVVLLGQPLIGVVLLALIKTAIETGAARAIDFVGGETRLAARLATHARNWTQRSRG